MDILQYFMISSSLKTSPNQILALHISGELSSLLKELPQKAPKLTNTSLGQQISSLMLMKLKSIKCISPERLSFMRIYINSNVSA